MFKRIFNDLIKSFKRASPEFRGSDHLGNKYFEILPERGVKPRKYFEPFNKDKFDQEVPVEWQAWLRGTRAQAPTQEEIDRNMAIMNAKKLYAAEKQNDSSLLPVDPSQLPNEPTRSFPARPGFHAVPGVGTAVEADKKPSKMDEKSKNDPS